MFFIFLQVKESNVNELENIDSKLHSSIPISIQNNDVIRGKESSRWNKNVSKKDLNKLPESEILKTFENFSFPNGDDSPKSHTTKNMLSDKDIRVDLKSLASLNSDGSSPRLRFDSLGSIISVSGHFALEILDLSSDALGSSIVNFLTSHPSLFGLGSYETTIINTDPLANSRGELIFKVDRTFKDLPIWGRQLVVTEKNGYVRSITGKFRGISQNLPIDQRLTDSQISELIELEFENKQPNYADVVSSSRGILIHERMPIYAYKVVVEAELGKKWELYFNPTTNNLIARIPLFYETSTPSTGIDLKGVTRSFNSWSTNDGYLLYDSSFPQNSYTEIGDHGTSDYSLSDDANSNWDPAAVSAIHNSKITYDYFLNTHNRNSIDNNGTAITSWVNVTNDGQPVFNAYWSSGVMRYGTGADGSENMAIALDVAGHEFTHGVIENTAGLLYQNQSGALNESFADIFGAMIDRDDWYIGEDLKSPYGEYDYLRDMRYPSTTGQPGHMDDYLHLPNTSDGDWGGVHYNSGIQNRAFYLLSEGLTDEGIGTSVGKRKAETLAYETLLKLAYDSEFVDSANTMILEAESIYGANSAEANAVRDAWIAVGITTDTVVSEGGNDQITLNAGDDVLVHLYPRDGSMDNLFTEEFDIYVQLVNQPFEGYISSAQIGPINDVPAKGALPSLHTTEDGSLFAAYVGNDQIPRWTYVSDDSEDTLIINNENVNSVASTANGDAVAFVLNDSNIIWIYSFTKNIWESIDVTGPNYSENIESLNVEKVDVINFDSTGQKIIFDYNLCRTAPGQSTCDDLWSIGIFDRGTQVFEYPFTISDSNINIGFPTFSNTRNDIIAFDYNDWTDYSTNNRAETSALIYNLKQRRTIGAYSTNVGETRTYAWGIPTFIGEDQALAVQQTSDTSTQLYQVGLDENYDYVADSVQWLFPFESGFGSSHRNAYQNIFARLETEEPNKNLGVLVLGSEVSAEFKLSSNGNREIAITAISTSNDEISTNLTNTVLMPDESLNFMIKLDSKDLALGQYSGIVTIQHSGDNNNLNFGISAFIDIDTDEDGSPNSIDNDDDNDGVPDNQDAFPLDSTEAYDNDQDGIGNNADEDDDNDGVNDINDAFPYDPNETIDTDGDGVGDNSDAFPENSDYTKDSDGDGMPDSWELMFSLDPNDVSDASGDLDGDGISNLQEFLDGTPAFGSIDIDGNERYDALTDGLLILRSMFGLDGSSLTAGTAASDAVYSDSDDLIMRINTLGDLADIDGSGDIDALTDGLLILRYLFGLEGETLVAGVVSSEATRTTEEIEAHLQMLMPQL